MNAQGIPVQMLSVELAAERYRELRIIAAQQNMNLAKFVRGLLENFLATRDAMQQMVAEDFSELIPPEMENGEFQGSSTTGPEDMIVGPSVQ
jgi:hypothetical protein